MAPLPWDKDAKQALKGVPFFVRPLVRRKVEERVSSHGSDSVTLADFREAEERYHSVSAGKSRSELMHMVPRDNQAGVDMVVLQTCHNELSNCPNPLIKTSEWKAAIEKWAKDKNISERLRQRIKRDKIFFHDKFKVSISGCPNGCSRPQIADLGLAGYIKPDVNIDECRECGSCAEVCPDEAITVDDGPPVFDRQACQGCLKCRDICPTKCISLSVPGVRISVGGKLGRHPHLAEVTGKADKPEQVIELLDKIINSYIEQGLPDERFADYWLRAGKESIK